MSLLDLSNITPTLWRAFQSKASAGAGQHPILERWERARRKGVSPEGSKVSHELLRGTALQERIGRSGALVSVANQHLAEAESNFSQAGFSLLLTDADGVILSARAGGEFQATATALNLLEGGRWSEEVQGTNAIGTALSEGRPVSVLGCAHYVRSNHDLVCYASPIHSPYGDVIGVLDITSYAAAANPAHQRAVILAAKGIEAALRQRAWGVPGASAVGVMMETTPAPALLVEWPGVIRAANPAAQGRLGRSLLGERFEDLGGLGWEALLGAAHGGGGKLDLRVKSGALQGFTLTLRPIEGPEKGTLGVVVILNTPRARRLRRSPSPTDTQPQAHPFRALKGWDPTLLKTKALAARIAPSTLPVLLLAETGTGKGLLAKSIHLGSRRSRGPFVHLNCGALTAQLLESELFGYAPGAFTGAKAEGAVGKIESAAGGTLFLDEIGEMSPALQAMLLKVLEEGTYFRVGETTPRRADVRLISATCRDLKAMMEAGQFRQDLYYRLRGVILTLPALKDRADLMDLAQALMERIAQGDSLLEGPMPTFSSEAEGAMLAYPWPGNVRELRMALHLAMTLAEGSVIDRHHLPPELQDTTLGTTPSPPRETLYTSKKASLLKALNDTAGNISEAARALGVSRSTIYRMLRRYDISLSRTPTDT